MPRPQNQLPSYRRHKASGQAIVTIRTADGRRRDVLLGKYGTKESKAEYERVLAQLRSAGPAGVEPAKARHGATVNEIVLGFMRHAAQHYRRPDGTTTNEVSEYRSAVRVLRGLHGHTPAGEFGPLGLQSVRQAMIDKGWCRTRINKQVGRVKRVFRWAAGQELVPAGVFQGLLAVDGLRRGRSAAKERPPVLPVPAEHVEATLPHLHPTVRAMVLLQRYTGCRPGEARYLRRADLDTTGPACKYTPADHKTAHTGRERIILIGPKAQQAIAPLVLAAEPAEYVFSPDRGREEKFAAMRAARKSKVPPSQVCRRKHPSKVKRKPGVRYTIESYARAIRRACEKAGVPPWHPNQLRHTYATEVRKKYGLEAAQVVLGLSKADVTQLYAERDLALAERVAAEAG